MYSIDRLFALTFYTVVFVSSTAAQQPTEILFGTYLPSSPRPEITYHQFNDSNLVKLGFNTIFQTVMHDTIHKDTMLMDPNVWHDNRAALGSSGFSNIVAMNGYWNRKDTTFTQVDWVKILTHSIYNNWEAEGRGDFYSDTIKMERNATLTTEVLDNSIVSIKTRSIEDSSYYTEQDQFVIRGPYIYQDCIYKVESRMGNDTIPYVAKFKLRVGNKPGVSEPVCLVKVWVNYYDNENRFLTKLLASKLITSEMLQD